MFLVGQTLAIRQLVPDVSAVIVRDVVAHN